MKAEKLKVVGIDEIVIGESKDKLYAYYLVAGDANLTGVRYGVTYSTKLFEGEYLLVARDKGKYKIIEL